MINFRSDCDVTMTGFRAVVSAVKRNDVQETTSPVATTDIPQTTQSTIGQYILFRKKCKNQQKSFNTTNVFKKQKKVNKKFK